MLRNTLLTELIEILNENDRFEYSDFKINSTKNTKGTSLRINYIVEPKFYITFMIPNTKIGDEYSSYYLFTGTVCPGPISYEESFSFKQQSDISSKIQTWQKTIWEEISTNPIIRRIEEQQNEIDELFEKVNEFTDELFSTSEANEMKIRLDALEKKLAGHVEVNLNDKEELKNEISKLHKDISTLKETVDFLSKKGWFKSFTSKVFKWTKDSDNRKMIGDGYKVIKEFLPENIKTSIP